METGRCICKKTAGCGSAVVFVVAIDNVGGAITKTTMKTTTTASTRLLNQQERTPPEKQQLH